MQKSDCGKIEVELKDKAGVEITNKSYSMKKLKEKNQSLQYGNFLKSATLLANVGKEEEIEGHLSTNDIEIKPISVLSDEDLFRACGGRTAHKGARHGLNLRGKLERIAEQERILLEKMKGKLNKHEVFREPCVKKQKKNPVNELNSSKDETSDDSVLPVDTETDYILKSSRKRKKRDKQHEQALVVKINGIGLDDSTKVDFETPTEREEDEAEPYNGTPVRKKKKSKKAFDQLNSIDETLVETSDVPDETPKKKKKKKGKRKLNEDDEVMPAVKENSTAKAKKVKLNDSYEASDDEEDIADKINAEQEQLHLSKSKKKSKKARKREKDVTKKTAAALDKLL